MKKAVLSDSAIMLAAIAVLAYASSMMTHEALGHGAYCIAAGGRNVMLTGWAESCSVSGGLGLKAAGPGVQYVAGLISWCALRQAPMRAAKLRYFLWLYMAFDLLISSGYVAFSGVTNIGDAADYIAGRSPSYVWRGYLVSVGAIAYALSLGVTALELNRFVGSDNKCWRRLSRLVWIPYGAAGAFACCSALLNETMPPYDAFGFAAASSFGAGSGLLSLPPLLVKVASKRFTSPSYVPWSSAWVTAATVVTVTFLVFVGPGLK